MTRKRALLLLAGLAVILLGGLLFACTTTPESVPIRTFERAQKVDVLCLGLAGPNAPEPLKQEECAPVPPDVNGGDLPNQLFALVTQTSRGEVAVVNLSSGAIIDQSHAVPGLNFLPVGANPTDIASTPDGRMAFVASAEPNKFAIYGIPGPRILGDQTPASRVQRQPTTLTSWPACALPQRPGALSVVPRRNPDGSTPTAPSDLAYELVAVLPGDRLSSPKVVTIDPRPFLRASPRIVDGKPIDDFGNGPAITPGTLEPCTYTSAIELAGNTAVPATFRPGTKWDDGVKWVDGGVDLSCAIPDQPSRCGLKSCACKDPTTGGARQPADAGAPDADADAGAAAACDPDGGVTDDTSDRALDLGPLDGAQPVAIARDDQTLYIADAALPLIHVVDLSVAGSPQELPPFVVTSLVDPSRVVSIRDIAVSPPTRDFKRFLYAVDRDQGSIAVFDVTDPKTASRTPLRRPHPELNPFQPPDRITFVAPVVTVAFARNDWPLTRTNGVALPNVRTGVLCNPNPNVEIPATGVASDVGAYYRPGLSNVDVDLGPRRLRGVFAFATLSTGEIDAIDIDDWDAPCRRPVTLNGSAGQPPVPALASVPQPNGNGPYAAPDATPKDPTQPPLVTQELFFPVSTPHTPRSQYMLRDDPTTGKHIPFLQTAPTLSSTRDVTPPLVGPGSEVAPKIRPTAVTPGAAPSSTDPGILLSFDDPNVHFDQDWTVTYEGALPGFDGLPATVDTKDDYASLVLSQPQARYCSKGVEDWTVGGERANAVVNALASAGRAPYPERIDRRMVDYVQVTDELLTSDDPFWTYNDSCWDAPLTTAGARYDFCSSFFGTASDPTENRDLPILEAYDDHLVVSRFFNFAVEGKTTTREVVYKDPSNAAHMKLLQCCFHRQVHYTIRAGAQWVAIGSKVGYLNHTTRASDNRCVQSCESREALLSSRAPSLPGDAKQADFAPFRDSPLAMRNPAFSFFVQNGYDDKGKDKVPVRDMAFHFSTVGQFVPLSVSLSANTIAVTPQSMKFIESLGQIAVVDGASQGLVLIELAGVTIARAPYF